MLFNTVSGANLSDFSLISVYATATVNGGVRPTGIGNYLLGSTANNMHQSTHNKINKDNGNIAGSIGGSSGSIIIRSTHFDSGSPSVDDWVDGTSNISGGTHYTTNNTELHTGHLRNNGYTVYVYETILFNSKINNAERIIVDNYLAAKYNISLTFNDLYDEDDAGNGNYDYNVAGIGRVDASNTHTDSQSDVVRINNPSGLGNGEYYLFGHDNAAFKSSGETDYPSSEGLVNRVARVWRGSEIGTITNFDISFDLSSVGGANSATDLRILIDTDNDGLFNDETVVGGGIISGAIDLGSDVYQFTGVTGLNDGIRFTIGSISAATPLPIELLSFNAILNEEKVELTWGTGSETNCDYFTIERSSNCKGFTGFLDTDGAGNSSQLQVYFEVDYSNKRDYLLQTKTNGF